MTQTPQPGTSHQADEKPTDTTQAPSRDVTIKEIIFNVFEPTPEPTDVINTSMVFAHIEQLVTSITMTEVENALIQAGVKTTTCLNQITWSLKIKD